MKISENLCFVFVITSALTVSACTAGESRSHQNFKSYMGAGVGRSIDDPDVFRNRYYARLFVKSVVLTNGNIEEEFKSGTRLNCRVFFEINNSIGQIVGWRYEGSEEDCAILP